MCSWTTLVDITLVEQIMAITDGRGVDVASLA
jgi:hypothetical protein